MRCNGDAARKRAKRLPYRFNWRARGVMVRKVKRRSMSEERGMLGYVKPPFSGLEAVHGLLGLY